MHFRDGCKNSYRSAKIFDHTLASVLYRSETPWCWWVRTTVGTVCALLKPPTTLFRQWGQSSRRELSLLPDRLFGTLSPSLWDQQTPIPVLNGSPKCTFSVYTLTILTYYFWVLFFHIFSYCQTGPAQCRRGTKPINTDYRLCNLTETLTIHLLISKSNQFTFVSDCTKGKNLVKFQQTVYKILWWETFSIQSRMHTWMAWKPNASSTVLTVAKA